MKVFLIMPNNMGFYITPTSPPSGLALLAAILKENNHDVEVLDMRLGYNDKELFDRLEKFKPDLVGMTIFSLEYRFVYELVDKTKEKNYKVIIGGPHVSVTHENVLEDCKADYAIFSEGEYTLLDLANGKKLEDIKGLIYRKNGEIIRNPAREMIHDLNKLPFPAFELFELDKYADKKIPIITSRGCPYSCVFCAVHLHMGKRFRARSPENIVDELERWTKKGYSLFGINDDCFTFDIERTSRICDLIVERGLKIRWDLRNGVRVDKVNEELLRKMKKAGCFHLALGIESIDKDVIRNIKKGINVDKVKDVVLIAKRLGFKVGGFFIIGLPGDNKVKFRKNIRFALSLPFDEIRFYNAVPYPGTELLEWVRKEGKLLKEPEVYLNNISSWDDNPLFSTQDFSYEERKEAFEFAEKYVMKYLMKNELGSVLGFLGWQIWRPKLTRKLVMNVGKKIWLVNRKLRK